MEPEENVFSFFLIFFNFAFFVKLVESYNSVIRAFPCPLLMYIIRILYGDQLFMSI